MLVWHTFVLLTSDDDAHLQLSKRDCCTTSPFPASSLSSLLVIFLCKLFLAWDINTVVTFFQSNFLAQWFWNNSFWFYCRCLRRSAQVLVKGDERPARRQNHQQEVPWGRRKTKAPLRDQHSEANGPPKHSEALRVLSRPEALFSRHRVSQSFIISAAWLSVKIASLLHSLIDYCGADTRYFFFSTADFAMEENCSSA